MDGRVIRQFFPSVSRCPHCRGDRWRPAGHSDGGSIRYRRCLTCSGTYKVAPIGVEIDRGTPSSSIVPFPF